MNADAESDTPNLGRRPLRLGVMEIFANGRKLVADQYWLFLGICLVGMLIASAVPFNLLLGPMVVGVAFALRRAQRQQTVEFGDLFRGFDWFGQSLIATLIFVGIQLVGMLLLMAPIFVLMFAEIARAERGASSGEPTVLIVGMVLLVPLVLLFIFVLQAALGLAFPLIFDRRLDAVAALRESWKAFRANAGGLLLWSVFTTLLGLAGVLACFVGVFFVQPWIAGGWWVLYRDIYPEIDSPDPAGEWSDS